MIQAHQLTKRYGDKTAVHTLSFTIAPGTVTGFLGPNGAGKSTTMRLIMGLDRPTSGTVTVNGKPYGQHRSPLREVGKNVSRFEPGDEVFGIGKGTFAEYALAREEKLVHKPTSLTFEQAAVLAISGLTALQGLRDHGRVEAGQKVLIVGASGGVGAYAVQIAKAFGAHVTGVCSSAKVEMVHSIGADRVIDYTREDFAKGEQRYDLILDIGGNSSLSRLRRALVPRGTLVITGGETDGRWLGGTDRQLRAMMLSPFVGQKLGPFISSENHEDMIVLKELIESGKLTPVIDRTYPLNEVPEAIRYLEEGHARGKVVITV